MDKTKVENCGCNASHIKEIAERFYYLAKAAGGHSSMSAESKDAEVEDLVGCTAKELGEAIDFLCNAGLAVVDSRGVTVTGDWKDKFGTCNKD